MKLITILLLILVILTLFACTAETNLDELGTEEEALETSVDLTDDVGELANDLEEIDTLLS